MREDVWVVFEVRRRSKLLNLVGCRLASVGGELPGSPEDDPTHRVHGCELHVGRRVSGEC